jgi:hypothetical protein
MPGPIVPPIPTGGPSHSAPDPCEMSLFVSKLTKGSISHGDAAGEEGPPDRLSGDVLCVSADASTDERS